MTPGRLAYCTLVDQSDDPLKVLYSKDLYSFSHHHLKDDCKETTTASNQPCQQSCPMSILAKAIHVYIHTVSYTRVYIWTFG